MERAHGVLEKDYPARMRTQPLPIFASFLLVSAALTVSACGGGTPATKTPEGATAAGNDATSATTAAKDLPPATTTTDLGDAGAGTKLAATDGKPASAKTSEPGRGMDDIRVAVLAKRDEARACYDKVLKDHPGLEGDVVVKWTIDPKGNVTEPVIDDSRSTIHEAAVGKCIIEVVKKIRFSESNKGLETRTSYPFNFNPKSSGKIAPSTGTK